MLEHLDLSIWLLSPLAPERTKGWSHGSWDICCNNATFLFLNSCLFVTLLSVSTVVLCNELTSEPTQHFLLILPVHSWTRIERTSDSDCVEYRTTQNTHASYQSYDNKTLLHPQNLCSGIKRRNWEVGTMWSGLYWHNSFSLLTSGQFDCFYMWKQTCLSSSDILFYFCYIFI